MTSEFMTDDEAMIECDKVYLPPVLDHGKLHLFAGYCDGELSHSIIPVNELLC